MADHQAAAAMQGGERIGGGEAHAESASGELAHHFDSVEQQTEATTLGMWVFLVTEIMFFGGLFTAYLVYRSRNAEAFAAGSHHLDILLGGVNTVVLICSSLTMALAVRGAQIKARGSLVGNLILTMALGSTFLVIKAVEYGAKFSHHLFPGPRFVFEGPLARQVEMFYSIYFAMTGLHALHMIVGVGILAVILVQAQRVALRSRFKTRVETVGLYWHFVDIVWIFLFPLLYLIGRH
jgi:cytochrome c oxidase subunit 3